MLMAFDIGNTQITIGVYENKRLRFVSNIATIASFTTDQYAVTIKNILELNDHTIKDITGVVISSVVPAVGLSISDAVKKLFHIKPVIIGPGIKTGLNIKVEDPAILGGDLVVGAVAAIALFPLPAIIFDFGTATKISIVSKDGSFLGCAITAGINISIDALATRTAALPYITLGVPKSIIGANSSESMKSGLIYGAAALIDGMADRIEDELGNRASLILTGGLSRLINGQTKREVIYCDNLLLEGLRIVYEKNQV